MSASESLAWLRNRLELPVARVSRSADLRWHVTFDDGDVLDLGVTKDVLSTDRLTRAVSEAGGVLPSGITPRHVLASLRTVARA